MYNSNRLFSTFATTLEMQPVETQSVEQEPQPVVQETQLQSQKTQQSDLEYKLFMQYHSKLTHVPSLLDLTSHFVAANIITSSDGQAVINTMIIKSQSVLALKKLLTKILLTLSRGHNDSKLFHKMLGIMQMYGDDIVQQLAADMLVTIVKQQSAVPTTSGMHLIM